MTGRPSPEPVLVVEDDRDIRAYLRAILWSAGHDVAEAGSAEAALALLHDLSVIGRKVLAVLVDEHLPGMKGIEFIRWLRSRPDTALLPLLVLTADESGRISTLEDGADDFILKPVAGQELVARVNAAIRARNRPPRLD